MANCFHIYVNAVGLLAPIRHWALPSLNSFSTLIHLLLVLMCKVKCGTIYAGKMPTHLCYSLKWLLWSVPRQLFKTSLSWKGSSPMTIWRLKLCDQNLCFAVCSIDVVILLIHPWDVVSMKLFWVFWFFFLSYFPHQ